jgi:peptide/nickel transport system permease protein
MIAYLIRRSLELLVVLFFSSLAIFTILNMVPGGPLSGLRFQQVRGVTSGEQIQENIERLERFYELDLPAAIRYTRWFVGWPKSDEDIVYRTLRPVFNWPELGERPIAGGIIFGDMDESWTVAKAQPVSELIRSRLGNTLLLMTSAVVLSLVVAIPIGVISAVKQYSKFDYVATTAAFFGNSMPVFWFGLLMIMFFAFTLPQRGLPGLPTGNAYSLRGAGAGSIPDRLEHLIMPTIVLSLLYMAGWSRFTRSSMLEVLREDFVRTARAKGLRERIVVGRHALQNALIPLVTIVTLQIPGIFGGAILTETVFNWPGMGRLYVNALAQSDWPVVLAIMFIAALLVVLANLLADVLYTVVDPRITYA